MLNHKTFSKPEHLLLAMAFIMPLVFAVWMVLLNNFVVEKADFTGKEIGLLQSLREIPGFLAFTVIYLLLFIKEQKLALLSLGITAFGVMITGFFPTALGLYLTTVLMSVGFHYVETLSQSLTLQWVDKEKTAHFMGRLIATKAVASLIAYTGIWLLMNTLSFDYKMTYSFFGGLGLILTIILALGFKQFAPKKEQHKKIILRRKYWLYYALVFFSGARRQIFVVFAGFLMVEKFHYSVSDITLLFLINYVFNWFFAAKIGKLIGRVGERKILIFEYTGLIILFLTYGLVESSNFAAALYVIDHILFALAIAIKTYFQKIAQPEDIAATSAVSFTISHIAAVFIPALLGLVWLIDSSLVFFIGAGFACCSFSLAFLVPRKPQQGIEWIQKEKY